MDMPRLSEDKRPQTTSGATEERSALAELENNPASRKSSLPSAPLPSHVRLSEHPEWSHDSGYSSANGSWGYLGNNLDKPTYYGLSKSSTYEGTRAGRAVGAGNTAPAPTYNSTASKPPQKLPTVDISHNDTSRTIPQPDSHTGYYHGIPHFTTATQSPQAIQRNQEHSRIRQSERDSERPFGNSENISREMVDIVHDPATGPRDVTVRMQMEIKEDFSEHLEAFSRLKRLGKVTEAQVLFHDKLDHLIEVSYLLAQYADMLISVGDYKSFQKLTFIPDASKSSTVPYDEAHMDRISSKYELLRLLSQPDMSPEMYINTCLMAMYGLVRTFEVESCFGSTEVSNQKLYLYPEHNYLYSGTTHCALLSSYSGPGDFHP